MPTDVGRMLEELRKWHLLAKVLLEIEGEILHANASHAPMKPALGSNAVLIMACTARASMLISESLASIGGNARLGTRSCGCISRGSRSRGCGRRREGPILMPDKSTDAPGGDEGCGVSEATRVKGC